MRVLALCVLVASLALFGCQKAGDTRLDLPTVQGQQNDRERIACYPDHGSGPVKYLPVDIIERRGQDGISNICFRDGVCYYGCPK